MLALVTGWWWLLALLALQLAVGLTLGRRFCLPCLLYFEVLQPRFGEARLAASRPPRVANLIGLTVLSAASIAYARPGTSASGSARSLQPWRYRGGTGFCTGCEAYKLACSCRAPVRLRPMPPEMPPDKRLIERP